MKIKYKIAVLFSILCSAIIGISGLFIYYFFSSNIEKQFQDRLLERAIIAGEVFLEKDELSYSKYEEIRARYLQSLPQEEVYYLEVREESISYSKVPENLLDREAIQASIENYYSFYRVDELLVCSLFYEDNEGNYVVLLAAKNEQGMKQLEVLKTSIILITLASLLVIAVVSLFFAKNVLKPINSMVNSVREISGNNLQLRLNEGNGKDEISLLAQTFNEMLERVEVSFETQNKFIHNASHELRTPLTIILGEAEYALKVENSRPDTEFRLPLEKIYYHAEHLRELLSSLLQLSEIKGQQGPSGFEMLRIDEVIQQVIIKLNEGYSPGRIKLEYKGVGDLIAESFEVFGNPLWLEIAFMNLVGNALKYSGDEPVKISLSHLGEKININIEDHGIGIPPGEVDRIFDAFYRGTNAPKGKGYGIGLALTYNIIKLHKGTITVTSALQEGSRITVELPGASHF